VAAKLSNGNYRGRVRDPRTGKQIPIHEVIGGPRSYRTLAERNAARRKARQVLLEPNAHLTVRDWWEEWTTSPAYGTARGRSFETTSKYREGTILFVERYGDRPLRTIDRQIATDWTADLTKLWTVAAIRTMFNDAQRAGKMTDPPFNKLGLAKPSRRGKALPSRQAIDHMHQLASELTPPSFAAYLFTLGWQGIRPGEGDALPWDNVDFDDGPTGTILIDRQWSVSGRRFKPPKHGSVRKLPMVPIVAERLAELPRESEFVFTTLNRRAQRRLHYTPSTRNHHWNRVRAGAGLGNIELYLATRHYFVTYAIEQLGLSVDDIGWYCGHRSAGAKIVRDHYLHPDDDARRARIAARLVEITHPSGRGVRSVG